MNFKPTKTGGRIAEGKTPFGDYRVELEADYDGNLYDASGNVIGRATLAIKDPAPTTDAEIRRAIARAATCRACPESRKVTLTVNTRPVYGVKCAKCGCGNLSLIRGQCPKGKWEGEQ